MANINDNWRSNLKALFDEFSALSGRSVWDIGQTMAGDRNFYTRVCNGVGDVLTERNLALHEKLWREVKKARRAKK